MPDLATVAFVAVAVLFVLAFMLALIKGYVQEGYQQLVVDTYYRRTAHDDRFGRFSTVAWRFFEYSLGFSLMVRVVPTLIFDPNHRLALTFGEVLSDWLEFAVLLLVGILVVRLWRRWRHRTSQVRGGIQI